MLSLAVAGNLAACSADPCRDYSAYTCAQLQSQTYNVYYSESIQPGNWVDTYVGQVQGLEACGSLAYSHADSVESVERRDDWSYVCCLRTSESECAEKHR